MVYARPMVRSVAIHPHGTLLTVGFSLGVRSLMDQRAGTVEQTFRHRVHSRGTVLGVPFVDSDPHLLVMSCSDRSIGVWYGSASRARSVAFWKDELPDAAHSLFCVESHLFGAPSHGISVCHIQHHGSVTSGGALHTAFAYPVHRRPHVAADIPLSIKMNPGV
jgi:hypothetical protein